MAELKLGHLGRWFETADLPVEHTPLLRLARVSEFLGKEVWVKRDDCGDFALAGCKARKLNLILPSLQRQRIRKIVGCGPPTSNSCRALAAACTKLGFECHLFLRAEAPDREKGNAALAVAFGATIHWVGTGVGWPELEALAGRWADQNDGYFLQPGGTEPLGVAAMVHAYFEFDRQAASAGLEPAAIVHASATGGVSAGLRIGAALCAAASGKSAPKIHSIAVVRDIYGDRMIERYGEIASQCMQLLGVDTCEPLHLNFDFVGERYDHITAQARQASALFARQEGLLMDGFYVARAGAALVELAKSNEGPLVLWHTGGTQGLLDESMMLALLG